MADTDSENEGILNNIQRLVIRPPGHTGKAKKGHICFDGGYETMNMGRVDFITNQEYDLFIRPDTANPRARLWFHFTVENTQRNQRVIFNVVNLSKWRTLFADGLTPVVKSTSRPRWQRMQQQFVFYYRSPIHSDHFVLSFAFSFDREDERYSFALAQPYSLSRYNLYLESILAAKHTFLHCQTIGRTIQERPLQLLTITDNQPIAQRRKRIVFLMGRVHASEAPSSFIMQGLIDFLTSGHEVAVELRQFLIFKLIPVVNPDGVFLGNTRGNLLGQDLNRCYVNPNPFSQPTVHAIKNLILSLDGKGLDLVIDIHSHISLLGLFIVGNSYEDVYRFERHVVFPKIMAAICPDFSMENTIYNDDEAKAGTARRFFCTSLSPEVNSYTLEASLYGYVDPESDASLPVVVPYTDDMYCRIGRNMARALWDYYKILNIVPLDEQASNTSSCVINAQLRSFNLHRLRTIEAQRDEAATTFDSEHHQLPDSNSVETKPIMTSADNREAAEKLEPNRILRVREQLEMVPFSPNKVVLSLDPMLQNQDTSFFTGNTSSRRQRRRNLFYEADTEEEVDCTLSIIELKTNLQFSSPSNSRSRRRRSRYLKTPGQEKNRNTTQTSELSVRGLGLKRRSSDSSFSQDDNSLELEGEDFEDGRRRAYADPRCEMKKKEIVVSGLAINTSDISSSDSESEDNRSYYNSDYQFLSAGYKMPDPILTSLVQPSVRKIGGGGAVSMSAFQAAAPRPQSLNLTVDADLLLNSSPQLLQCDGTSAKTYDYRRVTKGRARLRMRRRSTRRLLESCSTLCIGGQCTHTLVK